MPTKEEVLDALRAHGPLTTKEVRKLIDDPSTNTNNWLYYLCKQGIVIRAGTKKDGNRDVILFSLASTPETRKTELVVGDSFPLDLIDTTPTSELIAFLANWEGEDPDTFLKNCIRARMQLRQLP